MELSEISAFLAVLRAGSFTRGAERLHLSQPAVSRRIELLERELGAPLFERFPSGIRLTEAGEVFRPFAEMVAAGIEDGRTAVHEITAGEQGTIVLALTGTLAGTTLTTVLQCFRHAHPAVRLLLRTGRSDEVSAMVRQGDATLGLRYFPDRHPDVESGVAYEEQLVVVAGAQSAVAAADPRTPDALQGIPWVTYPVGTGSAGEPFAELLDRHIKDAELGDEDRVVIDSLTAQKRLIEADFGLGLLPESSVVEELRAGSLRQLAVPALEVGVPVMAIRRRRGYLGPAAQRLLDMLTHQADA